MMPNMPQTVVAFLACASIGAVWSSCAPEMGRSVVLDRFRQIGPRLIFATDSYTYAAKSFDRRAVLEITYEDSGGAAGHFVMLASTSRN